MNLLDWDGWELAQRLRGEAGRAEERWFLQKLHRPQELTVLATIVADRLHRQGKPCSVQVQSVWIDSLPQVVGHADGKRVKCELADLLYVVEVQSSYGVRRERALLMQGKMTARHNKLPLTGSTRKERRLLERHDWRQKIELHRAHAISTTTSLGEFSLRGLGEVGFEPFARYLLMAQKRFWWDDNRALAPYVTGWPQSYETQYLKGRSNVSLAECAVLMSENSPDSPGQSVDATQSDWNKLIFVLRNGNASRYMTGYGGQAYVTSSDIVRSSASGWRRYFDMVERAMLALTLGPRLAAVGWDEPFRWHQPSGGMPPPGRKVFDFEGGEGFPLLPVITVTIQFDEEGSRGRER